MFAEIVALYEPSVSPPAIKCIIIHISNYIYVIYEFEIIEVVDLSKFEFSLNFKDIFNICKI